MPSSLIHDSPLNWICKRPIRVNTHACYYLLLCSTSVLFVSIHTPTKTWECSGIQLRIPYATLHRENIKIDSLKNFPPKLPRHFYTLIISNCKFEIINVTQIAFRITSSLSFWHAIATLTYYIWPLVFLKQPVPSQYNSSNSSYLSLYHYVMMGSILNPSNYIPLYIGLSDVAIFYNTRWGIFGLFSLIFVFTTDLFKNSVFHTQHYIYQI